MSRGSTWMEALDRGTLFTISNEDEQNEYTFIDARTPEQAAQWAAKRGARPGIAWKVFRHMPGSRIGSTMMEHIGSVVIPTV
jgi:hypothetical protein